MHPTTANDFQSATCEANQHPAGTTACRTSPASRSRPNRIEEYSPGQIDHMHQKRFPSVEMPNLIRSQPVKRREVLPFQQKVDRRRCRPRSRKPRRQSLARNHHLRPVRLPKIPALRMRFQPQLLDPVPGVLIQLFLRSRETFALPPTLSRLEDLIHVHPHSSLLLQV